MFIISKQVAIEEEGELTVSGAKRRDNCDLSLSWRFPKQRIWDGKRKGEREDSIDEDETELDESGEKCREG